MAKRKLGIGHRFAKLESGPAGGSFGHKSVQNIAPKIGKRASLKAHPDNPHVVADTGPFHGNKPRKQGPHKVMPPAVSR